MNNFELKQLSPDELIAALDARVGHEPLAFTSCNIEGADLEGRDLSNIDFTSTIFRECNLEHANMDGCNLYCTSYIDCRMRYAVMTNCDLRDSNLRYMDLTGVNISGSNLHRSILEYTVLDGVIDDENTQFYRLLPPAEGAFIGWKCCTAWRVVMLLIPADAKRVSATAETCRCSKAKVLSIKSIDESESYDWAQSTVDQDFYYEVGKWVEPANGFCEDRWRDSSEGIHFFMERQQCVDYQTK